MADKYHLKDDGMPGLCTAKTLDDCPKARAGDSFHGDLAEVTLESERRFEADHGSTATVQKDQSGAAALDYQTILSTISFGSTGSRSSETAASRAAARSYEAADPSSISQGTQSLAYDLRYAASDDSRSYILNEVPVRELSVFRSERKGYGRAIDELVKIHRSVSERHGQGGLGGLPPIGDQLKDHRTEIQVRNGYGVGSLRSWGEPGDSIQNMSPDTGRLLAQHVIDSYGAENAERFWSEASARTTANRPTLPAVFRTLRKFDREKRVAARVAKS